MYKQEKLKLEQEYRTEVDSFALTNLKFYVSDVQLYAGGKKIRTQAKSHFLYDASSPQNLEIALLDTAAMSFDCISLCIGVDSIINSAGAMGGDLDPTNGMYWTWQSGYINVKIEGRSTHCSTRKNRFQYHLGGYIFPNNALKKIDFPVKNAPEIVLCLVMDEFFEQVFQEANCEVMSPSTKAVRLAQIFANTFFVKE